jgi:hypothetical protein
MSYVVKCTLVQVNHIDHSPEAKKSRNDDWKSRTGFIGLKGGMTTYFLFDTAENAYAFAESHRADPLVIGGQPTTTVMPLEDADGLAVSDFYVPDN